MEPGDNPGLLADRAQFDYFVMHAYLPMPGEASMSNTFDIDELNAGQQAALGKLVALYVESFGNPGLDVQIALLASGTA